MFMLRTRFSLLVYCRYELLEEQGLVYSGRHLEMALSSLHPVESLNESELDQKILELEEESKALNVRKRRLRELSSDLR